MSSPYTAQCSGPNSQAGIIITSASADGLTVQVKGQHTTQNSQNKWTKISDLETTIFELNMMVKSGLVLFFYFQRFSRNPRNRKTCQNTWRCKCKLNKPQNDGLKTCQKQGTSISKVKNVSLGDQKWD